jgi:hypothetical protein
LISDCQNLTIVGRRNPTGAGVQQHPIVDILPAPESGHRRTRFRPGYCWIPVKPAEIQPALDGSCQNRNPESDILLDSGIRPDREVSGRIRSNFLAGIRQRRSDIAEFLRHLPNSHFIIFFVRVKHRKLFSRKLFFSENDFVEIILQQKSFYVETNEA